MDLEDVQEAIRNGPAYVLEVTVARCVLLPCGLADQEHMCPSRDVLVVSLATSLLRESSSGTPARPAPLAATSAAHSVMSLYSNNSRDLVGLRDGEWI